MRQQGAYFPFDTIATISAKSLGNSAVRTLSESHQTDDLNRKNYLMTKHTKGWTAADIPSQTGRRALVTGANSGIGFHTALELARHGAEVIIPARTEAKANDAAKRILREVPSAKLLPEILDLADLASIHALAKRLIARFPGASLDLLINNAGVMALPTREVTCDGFERQFGTNYLGPFALTALLFSSIKPLPGSRIITVASAASNQGKITFDNLQSECAYTPMGTYAQSKLADLMFTLELQHRLTRAKSPIISAASHPGYTITNLQGDHLSFGLKLIGAIMKPLAQNAAQGALPTLYAATKATVLPGGYYGPNGIIEIRGTPAPAKIPTQAQDSAVACQLWEVSERLTAVAFPDLTAR